MEPKPGFGRSPPERLRFCDCPVARNAEYVDVLLVAGPADAHADAVEPALGQLGLVFRRTSLDVMGKLGLEWCPSGSAVLSQPDGDVLLTSQSTVWWRRPGRFDASAVAAGEVRLAVAESEAFFLGVLLAANPRWVDPPQQVALAENKLNQLSRVSALGIRSPLTLVSNKPGAVRSFVSSHRTVIKALSSGVGPAPYVQEAPEDDLGLAANCPLFLQQWISATADLRIVTVGDEAFVWRRNRQPRDPPDWREVDPAGQGFEFRQTSAALGRAALAVARELGLSMSVQDWLETREGSVFLEVNPQGEWLFLPSASEILVPILARHLAGE